MKIIIMLSTLVLITKLQSTSANYELGVQLHSYSNPLSRDSSGDSCEGLCFFSCACDTKFTFCLRPSGSLRDNNRSNCPLGVFETREFEDQDSINFNRMTNLGNNLSNPFFYRATGNWPGRFQLYVRVIDVDLFIDDLIANIYVDMALTPSPSFTTPRTFSTSNNVILEMSFRVRCTGGSSGNTCQTSTCLQGSIRLRGGTATRGRVEVCNNNVWGTVCDDFWGAADARVVCRQLGYSPNGAAALTSGFTNGAGQIWLDNVHCRGTETRLIDCPANALGIHDCGHIEDAGVRCSPTSSTCLQGSVRLRGGTATQGRVEICNNNVWGTVCDDSWGTADARVVCRQLGYSSNGAVALTSGFTNGVGRIWLDDVHCRGTETRLIDCAANPLGIHDCEHTEDAGVRCFPFDRGNTDESVQSNSSSSVGPIIGGVVGVLLIALFVIIIVIIVVIVYRRGRRNRQIPESSTEQSNEDGRFTLQIIAKQTTTNANDNTYEEVNPRPASQAEDAASYIEHKC